MINSMIFRCLTCIAGIALLFPIGLLALLASFIPITPSGMCYLIGIAVVAAGAVTAPWRRSRFRGLTRTGILFLCLVAAVRLASGGRETDVSLITLPGPRSSRWIDRLFHERDIGLVGQQVAFLTGIGLSPREHDGLKPALEAAYAAMDEAKATGSSPFMATYRGLQNPGAFDAVVIEPALERRPTRIAVVFLHGFAGNFAVQAWLVSRAAARIGAVTVCPSVGWRGDWWTDDGESTVRHTLDYLHARGVQRIYLAGLSNGSVGTCRLASRFSSELAGLILISGADPEAPDTDLPVLLLQGANDERMPAFLAIEFAQRAGARATYREFDGDHLLLAKRAQEVRDVFADWLSQQETKAHDPSGGTR
jgi:pimeloyl-ACP methyl ester carboxylesterase